MTMTVAQFRRLLDGIDDDMVVVVQEGGDGNGYSPLEAVEQALYVPSGPYSGTCFDHVRHIPKQHQDAAVRCIVLVPTE